VPREASASCRARGSAAPWAGSVGNVLRSRGRPTHAFILACRPASERSSAPDRASLRSLDPRRLRELRIIASHLLDEALGVLAPNEHLERVSERASCRQRRRATDKLRRRLRANGPDRHARERLPDLRPASGVGPSPLPSNVQRTATVSNPSLDCLRSSSGRATTEGAT
jgi:hypothetical protein